jgi:hypothetical protein
MITNIKNSYEIPLRKRLNLLLSRRGKVGDWFEKMLASWGDFGVSNLFVPPTTVS